MPYRFVRTGQSYSLRYYPSRASVFGPFEDIRREALVERLVARRRAPGEDSDASGCAGVPANFVEPSTGGGSVSVTWPDEPDDPDEGSPEAAVYTAVWWELEDVRVENPEDSEQYVITKRILQARYRRPDNTEVTLDNRPIFDDFPAGA